MAHMLLELGRQALLVQLVAFEDNGPGTRALVGREGVANDVHYQRRRVLCARRGGLLALECERQVDVFGLHRDLSGQDQKQNELEDDVDKRGHIDLVLDIGA